MPEKFRPNNKIEAIAYEKGVAWSETNLLTYLFNLAEDCRDNGDTIRYLTFKALYDGIVAGDHMPEQPLTTTLVAAGGAN